MTGSPYFDRVLILVGFFLIAGIIDKLIKGKDAVRWREYLFLLACGVVGTVAGILHDQITVTVSPEYYGLAKDVTANNLRWGVVQLGAKTGFTAGIVLSGIFLLSSKGRMFGPGPFSYLKTVCIYSIGFALSGALAGNWVVPQSWVLFYEVPEDAVVTFKVVVAEHYGLYLGAVVGTIRGIMAFRETPLLKEPNLTIPEQF